MAYLIRKGLQLICNHSLLGLDYVIELASQWVTSIIRSGQFHINVIVFVTTTRHQAPGSQTLPGESPNVPGLFLDDNFWLGSINN